MGTITNALELLNLFSRARPLAGLSELARLSGTNKATCHRMLSELADFGLVEQIGTGRQYRLGPATLRLAALREAGVPTKDAALPVMNALAQVTGETVHLSLLEGTVLRTLAFAYSSAHGTKVMMEDAETLPLHATSSGLAVLAFQSSAFREKVLAGPLPQLTPQTMTDPAQLRQRLERVRFQGFAESAGGFEAEVHSIAVPLFDALGRCSGGLAVAAPVARMTPAQCDFIRRAVLLAGEDVTRLWGGSLPETIASRWRNAGEKDGTR